MSHEEYDAKMNEKGKGIVDRQNETIPFKSWRDEKLKKNQKEKEKAVRKKLIVQISFTGTADMKDSIRDLNFVHAPFNCCSFGEGCTKYPYKNK